jgi:hypothetical protein
MPLAQKADEASDTQATNMEPHLAHSALQHWHSRRHFIRRIRT